MAEKNKVLKKADALICVIGDEVRYNEVFCPFCHLFTAKQDDETSASLSVFWSSGHHLNVMLLIPVDHICRLLQTNR
jgi:hypothetical protein